MWLVIDNFMIKEGQLLHIAWINTKCIFQTLFDFFPLHFVWWYEAFTHNWRCAGGSGKHFPSFSMVMWSSWNWSYLQVHTLITSSPVPSYMLRAALPLLVSNGNALLEREPMAWIQPWDVMGEGELFGRRRSRGSVLFGWWVEIIKMLHLFKMSKLQSFV